MTYAYTYAQVSPAATTETTLYTAPSTTSKVLTMTVCNRGVAGSFRISRSAGGGVTDNKNYWFYDTPILASGTSPYIITTPFFLSGGDAVRVYASHANMSFQLDAQES